MVAASSYQIRRICAKCTVPHPSLVTCECGFQRERFGLSVEIGRVSGIYRYCPDTCGMVCTAGGEMADIWREQNASDIGRMRAKLADGQA